MHAVGGILGALLTGVFVSASPGGVGFSEGVTMGKQLYIQTVAVLATIVYDAIVSFVLLKVIDAVIGLLVNADEETEGLDDVLQDERAYQI